MMMMAVASDGGGKAPKPPSGMFCAAGGGRPPSGGAGGGDGDEPNKCKQGRISSDRIDFDRPIPVVFSPRTAWALIGGTQSVVATVIVAAVTFFLNTNHHVTDRAIHIANGESLSRVRADFTNAVKAVRVDNAVQIFEVGRKLADNQKKAIKTLSEDLEQNQVRSVRKILVEFRAARREMRRPGGPP